MNPNSSTRYSSRHQPEVFAPDPRPGADVSVYCKGCGQPLPGQARYQLPKAVVTEMMCSACQEEHGHPLIPRPGAPTFCYRCGGRDDIFVGKGSSPVTYHVCPRCVPERAARYRAGDFGGEGQPVAAYP